MLVNVDLGLWLWLLLLLSVMVVLRRLRRLLMVDVRRISWWVILMLVRVRLMLLLVRFVRRLAGLRALLFLRLLISGLVFGISA